MKMKLVMAVFLSSILSRGTGGERFATRIHIMEKLNTNPVPASKTPEKEFHENPIT
jgi:hypothetical protein